ncbi:hypothetical protein THRCLA_08787 [Thraustotheca clavata]|uniref:Cilia- and flagella-associated protein 157 n=1 Tax=Thraustotheca clavata TaxID=74557 RepID=A0A1V9Z2L6_9STRA|nr:hypothetical protein THRCLA_08787 [Thraustotheca clavata]
MTHYLSSVYANINSCSKNFVMATNDNIESFRLAAQRALKDQKVQYELEQQVAELHRLQTENKQLLNRINELQTALEAGIEDRERVILFKIKRIEELQEKITLLENEAAQHTNSAIRSMQEKLDAMTQERDAYLMKYKEADGLLEEMREFQSIKGNMQKQIDRLHHEKEFVEDNMNKQIQELEKRNIMFIQRMRKERDEQLEQTRQDMHKMMTESLDGTTRRAVEENEKLTVELRYQSSKIEKLIRQNDALLREKQEQRNNTDILSEMTETLSRKIKFYEKLFKKMHHKERIIIEEQLATAQQFAQAEKLAKHNLLLESPPKSIVKPLETIATCDPEPWKEAFEQHLEARNKSQRSITTLLQYNRFVSGGDHPIDQSPTRPSISISKQKALARRHLQAQGIETVRLPNLTETEVPSKFNTKYEFNASPSPRRIRDSPKTARI